METASTRAMSTIPDTMTGRVWFSPPDFPGYLVADDGCVVSALREPRVLKPIRRGAYWGFTLRNKVGALTPVYLHRLVAESFCGSPAPGDVCRHLDGDRANNAAGNLAWGTQQENVDDQKRHGTTCRGVRNGMAKLTAERVADMRRDRKNNGTPYHKIAKRFGVSTMTAYRAVTGKSWR